MYIDFLTHPLSEIHAGAKAFHLSKMKRAGFNVPGGIVILKSAFEKFSAQQLPIDTVFISEINEALATLNAPHYMVRSSAIGEDSFDSSFAGQLDSFICSSDSAAIIDKIKQCWNSYYKENVQIYQAQTGKKLDGMGVIVQELIQPDFAGVLFTQHPLNEEEMLLEYVTGHGEKLVSGAVTPESIVFKPTDPKHPVFNELISIGKQLEKFYSYALDIEWAIKNKELYIVQSRPITTVAKSKRMYWSNTNVNENYPEAISPLLYSIARDSYYNYFKNLSKLFLIGEDKIRELESAYCNVIGIFGGRMYYNMSSIHEIISASPFSENLKKSFDNFVGYAAETNNNENQIKGSKWKFLKEVIKFNRSLETTVKTFEINADNYSQHVEKAISFQALKTCFHAFIEIRMHSWYKASLADFFAMLYHGILGKYCKRFYEEDATGIHNKLIQAIPGLISTEPILKLYQIKCALRKNETLYSHFKNLGSIAFVDHLHNSADNKEAKDLIETYINNWGFRCTGELMLTYNTYIEEPHKFIDLLKQYDQLPESNPEALIAAKYEERKKVFTEFKNKIYKKRGLLFPLAIAEIWLLKLLVKLASNGIAARERVRLKQALLYFRFKQVLGRTGVQFEQRKWIQSANDIHFLRYQEIAENFSSSDLLFVELKERIASRKAAFEKTKKLVYPDDFSTFMGEYPLPSELPATVNPYASEEGILKGLPVCGGKIKAKVKVLESVMEAFKLEKGDILVTRQTDPGWVLVFPLISGLIVERGGMLSHGAIVSREFGIPAIVGVENASKLLKDGDLILLNADTGEISICDE